MAEGVRTALALLQEPARLAALATSARGFANRHRGAARRMAQRIAALLPN